ncbi:MAG: ATP-binding protein [Gammaproteobacteria bacterium]|nr:ATP-binding protein [Gammaproteobacteria bacterium]
MNLRFGISSKLTLAFVIFTMAVISAGVGSIFYINKMGDVFGDIYNENMTTLSTVAHLDDSIHEFMIASYQYLGTQDPDSMLLGKRLLDERSKSITTEFQQQAPTFDDALPHFLSMDEIRKEAFDLHFNFNTQLAYELINSKGQETFNKLDSLMQEISDRELEIASNSLKRGLDIKDSIILYLILVIIARIILNSTIAIFIYRSISRPLIELAKFIRYIHKTSDFSKRIITDHKDEMGDAARAINGLTDSFEQAINEIGTVLNDHSDGNYSARMITPLKGDLDRLKNSVNESGQRTQQTLTEINHVLEKAAAGDFSQNITLELKGELKNLIKNINMSLSELDDTIENLGNASRAKTDFLSSMSHELRTPMNAIMGFAQLLKLDYNEEDNPQQLENVDEILTAAKHLMLLINEILDLAKIESGHVEMSLEEVKISDIISTCLKLICPLVTKRNLTMSIIHNQKNIPSNKVTDITDSVWADHTRLNQVMLNLLSNAVKYNSENGKIEIRIENISEEEVIFSISDTGAGLTEDKIQHLFNAFERLDAEHTDIEGTGIGLIITKKLVELMGGEIGVNSEQGKGSTFWFRIPAFEHTLGTANIDMILSDDHDDTSHIANADESNKTVLYVEDNPANLRLVTQLFTRIDGVTLLSAPNASLGLELAEAHKPNLIMLDINLPGIDGFEALKRLQAMESCKDTPIIAISANAMNKDIQKGLKAGFLKYLTKPINVVELKEAVTQIINDQA